MSSYDTEKYWTRVAEQIDNRGENYLAGDDNPFYRLKRERFLKQFLDTIDFRGKTVLEVGCGPGGNLRRIAESQNPKRILGVDISASMREIANRNLRAYANILDLRKIDGNKIPFEDRSIDTTFTVTVLQHNTNDKTLRALVAEICRVTQNEIVIIEDVGESENPCEDGSWIDRPVAYYRSMFSEFGYKMDSVELLPLKVTGWWYRKVYYGLYKRFVNKGHKEGEPIGSFFKLLMAVPMLLTRHLDECATSTNGGPPHGIAKMVYRRT